MRIQRHLNTAFTFSKQEAGKIVDNDHCYN